MNVKNWLIGVPANKLMWNPNACNCKFDEISEFLDIKFLLLLNCVCKGHISDKFCISR